MDDTIRYCQFCHEILPPWRRMDCAGENQNGRGNCELRNGSNGRRYNQYASFSDQALRLILEGSTSVSGKEAKCGQESHL